MNQSTLFDSQESSIKNATEVRKIAETWLGKNKIEKTINLGLPEYDDRWNYWRVALLAQQNEREPIGELRVDEDKVICTGNLEMIAERCKITHSSVKRRKSPSITFRPIESRVLLGDAKDVLTDYPPDTTQLIFTSPPYFNAKPECHESLGYSDYLNMLRDIFTECHRVLSEGRFLVVNTSPVLIRRPHRQAASRRIPITYDLHQILNDIDFEFVDDIIWEKPEGAGWHLGRGRRFAADRQPLQYKPVTVTENITVYRKRTDMLIDWNIRNHPDQQAADLSRIEGKYERTNIWKIAPANHPEHPAVFPVALAERVIRYYSFRGDMVLDPFAGIGTTGRAATKLNRRYMLIEKSKAYFKTLCSDLAENNPIKSYEFAAGAL